uniref:Protein kinase domain-containing protein n=1 Tax=Nothobranchius furzeri TaxID=105023 RepID=A0A8C6Q6I2_NOTFU
MLVALNKLDNLSFTHLNVGPEDIMLVDHDSQPFKVKLTSDIKDESLVAFIDFLKMILAVNPENRVSSADALNHRFITMECISGSSLNSVSDTHAVSTGGQTTEKDSVTEMGIHESDSNLTWSPSDTEYSPLTLERGGKIIHTSDVYQVVGLLGTGSFGKVFKCRKEGTDETVAMKVFRKGNHWQAKREVNSHNQVSVLDLDKNNLIRLIDSFVYKDCFCLTFECLYLNLTELIIRRYEGLEVNDIRSIAQQVLLALRALKIIGMTHTDIKPNNIMLTAPQGPQSLNVKLINFGSARKTAELSEYSVMQNERYRAPEVILGLPRDESIDMWGLGCTLAYLYQASHLFPKDEYITMHFIVKHLGLPDKEIRTKPFWRLRIFEEYKHPVCCHAAPEYPCDDFLTLPPNLGNRNDSLTANPADRILPEEALNHPFITMNYLPGSSLSSNVSEIHKIPTGSLITDQDRVTEVKIHESGLNLTKSTDEMESSNLILKTGVKIFHQSDAYQVEELLGTGSVGV